MSTFFNHCKAKFICEAIFIFAGYHVCYQGRRSFGHQCIKLKLQAGLPRFANCPNSSDPTVRFLVGDRLMPVFTTVRTVLMLNEWVANSFTHYRWGYLRSISWVFVG